MRRGLSSGRGFPLPARGSDLRRVTTGAGDQTRPNRFISGLIARILRKVESVQRLVPNARDDRNIWPQPCFRSRRSNRASVYLNSGAVRLLIGEPLAFGAADHGRGAGQIVEPGRDAVVVSELELGEVAVQMFLAAVLVDAGRSGSGLVFAWLLPTTRPPGGRKMERRPKRSAMAACQTALP